MLHQYTDYMYSKHKLRGIKDLMSKWIKKLNLKLNLYTLCHRNIDISIRKTIVYNGFGNVELTKSFSILEK